MVFRNARSPLLCVFRKFSDELKITLLSSVSRRNAVRAIIPARESYETISRHRVYDVVALYVADRNRSR